MANIFYNINYFKKYIKFEPEFLNENMSEVKHTHMTLKASERFGGEEDRHLWSMKRGDDRSDRHT